MCHAQKQGSQQERETAFPAEPTSESSAVLSATRRCCWSCLFRDMEVRGVPVAEERPQLRAQL